MPGGEGRVARAYRRYARSPGKQRAWSAENPGNQAIRAELVATALTLAGPDLAAARQVLDIGCGTGWWLEWLADATGISAALHGLELLPERAAAARARVPHATVSVGTACALPYESSAFDVVTLFAVLSSIASPGGPEQALREARRVVVPGGPVLIWEPRLPNPLNRNTVLINKGKLRQALGMSRLEARTTTVLPALARRLGSHTDRIYPLLRSIAPLRTHRLVCARWPDG